MGGLAWGVRAKIEEATVAAFRGEGRRRLLGPKGERTLEAAAMRVGGGLDALILRKLAARFADAAWSSTATTMGRFEGATRHWHLRATDDDAWELTTTIRFPGGQADVSAAALAHWFDVAYEIDDECRQYLASEGLSDARLRWGSRARGFYPISELGYAMYQEDSFETEYLDGGETHFNVDAAALESLRTPAQLLERLPTVFASASDDECECQWCSSREPEERWVTSLLR